MRVDYFALLATRIAALEDSLAMTPDSHNPGYALPVIARERSDRSNLYGKTLNMLNLLLKPVKCSILVYY